MEPLFAASRRALGNTGASEHLHTTSLLRIQLKHHKERLLRTNVHRVKAPL